jgi:SOS response regulatory protein OraA/RecX
MKIEIVFDRQKRVSLIYQDGTLVRTISHQIVSRMKLQSIAHDEQFFTQLHELEAKCAFLYATKSIAKQTLHSKQLVKRLKMRFVPEDEIEHVIVRCKELGFLQDEEVVLAYKRKWTGQGRSRLDQAYRARHLNIPLGENLGDDREALLRLMAKKFPDIHSQLLTFEQKAKIIRFLQRRGFPYSLILEELRSVVSKEGD